MVRRRNSVRRGVDARSQSARAVRA
jgi:hypothetical protein